jgi:tetratricopeptide (TPR) repeat protein
LEPLTLVTRLEFFLVTRGLKPVHIARESGISRQHLLRVRRGVMEPSRWKIAQIVSAVRRLTLMDVQPTELFELSVEENGTWALAHVREEAARTTEVFRAQVRDAAIVVKETLTGRVGDWHRTLVHHGVTEFIVRHVLLTAHRIVDARPARAIQLLNLAEQLVDDLPTLTSSYLRCAMRGRTFLDRAFANRVLGHFNEAASMLDRAEEEFRQDSACTHELAQTWYERSALRFKVGDLDMTITYARQARNIFVLTGDRRRTAKARMIEACVLVDRHSLHAARDAFRDAARSFYAFEDQESLSCALLNLGSTEMRLNHLVRARKLFEAAQLGFAKLKMHGEVVRTQWNLAHLVAFHENLIRGLPLLQQARNDFATLHMTADAAFVGLDIVRALFAAGRVGDAGALCRIVIPEFEESGVSANVREALAYLRAAVERRDATAELVAEVRTFIERAPHHPDAVFLVQ